MTSNVSEQIVVVGASGEDLGISRLSAHDRRGVIKRSLEGTFETSSANNDIRHAVSILNELKTSMEVRHQKKLSSRLTDRISVGDNEQQSASLPPMQPTDPVIEGPSTSTVVVAGKSSQSVVTSVRVATQEPLETSQRVATLNVDDKQPRRSRSALPQRTVSSRSLKRGEMRKINSNVSAAGSMAGIEGPELDASARMSPSNLDPHSPTGAADDAAGSTAVSVAEMKRRELSWMHFWGKLEDMKGSNNVLVDDLEAQGKMISRLTTECSDERARFEEAAKDVEDLEGVLSNERVHHGQVLAVERQRLDAIRVENDRLLNKANEMRRQVTLAEGAVHKMQQETEHAQRAAAKAKAECEDVKLRNAIEIVKLKQALSTKNKDEEEKELRRIFLEEEHRNQTDHIRTLTKTVEVLTEENKTLSSRLAAATASAATTASQARNKYAQGIDATTLQQLTQKAYVKRETELLEQNAALRRDMERIRFRFAALKARYEATAAAYERALMQEFDAEATTGARFRMPRAPTNTKSTEDPSRRRSTKNKIAKYACVPFVKPRPPDTTEEMSALGPLAAQSHFGEAIERSRGVVKTVGQVVEDSYNVCQQLWDVINRCVPTHASNSPEGEKEVLHQAVQQYLSKMADLTNSAVRMHVKGLEALLATEQKREEKVAMERAESQKLDAKRLELQEKRSQELQVKCMSIEDSLQEARAILSSTVHNVKMTYDNVSTTLLQACVDSQILLDEEQPTQAAEYIDTTGDYEAALTLTRITIDVAKFVASIQAAAKVREERIIAGESAAETTIREKSKLLEGLQKQLVAAERRCTELESRVAQSEHQPPTLERKSSRSQILSRKSSVSIIESTVERPRVASYTKGSPTNAASQRDHAAPRSSRHTSPIQPTSPKNEVRHDQKGTGSSVQSTVSSDEEELPQLQDPPTAVPQGATPQNDQRKPTHASDDPKIAQQRVPQQAPQRQPVQEPQSKPSPAMASDSQRRQGQQPVPEPLNKQQRTVSKAGSLPQQAAFEPLAKQGQDAKGAADQNVSQLPSPTSQKESDALQQKTSQTQEKSVSAPESKLQENAQGQSQSPTQHCTSPCQVEASNAQSQLSVTPLPDADIGVLEHSESPSPPTPVSHATTPQPHQEGTIVAELPTADGFTIPPQELPAPTKDQSQTLSLEQPPHEQPAVERQQSPVKEVPCETPSAIDPLRTEGHGDAAEDNAPPGTLSSGTTLRDQPSRMGVTQQFISAAKQNEKSSVVPGRTQQDSPKVHFEQRQEAGQSERDPDRVLRAESRVEALRRPATASANKGIPAKAQVGRPSQLTQSEVALSISPPSNSTERPHTAAPANPLRGSASAALRSRDHVPTANAGRASKLDRPTSPTNPPLAPLGLIISYRCEPDQRQNARTVKAAPVLSPLAVPQQTVLSSDFVLQSAEKHQQVMLAPAAKKLKERFQALNQREPKCSAPGSSDGEGGTRAVGLGCADLIVQRKPQHPRMKGRASPPSPTQ